LVSKIGFPLERFVLLSVVRLVRDFFRNPQMRSLVMKGLPVLDARAAFCDVGSEHMHVSIAGGPPKVFGTVTSQLHELRDWLLSQSVNSVAMEATGVY
jgi:hypothetical protein